MQNMFHRDTKKKIASNQAALLPKNRWTEIQFGNLANVNKTTVLSSYVFLTEFPFRVRQYFPAFILLFQKFWHSLKMSLHYELTINHEDITYI